MSNPAADRHYLAGLFALTVATGVVDAVSYLAIDRVFTGNMTGNVLFVGFGFAGAGGVPLLNNIVALGGFVIGVVFCGLLVRGRSHVTRLPTANLLALAFTSTITVAVSIVWLFTENLAGVWIPIVTGILALTMGAQAVAVRGTRIPDVNTIVITTTLVNFALDSPLVGGTGDKWVRRLGSVLSMGLGGALGALAIRFWSDAGALILGAAFMIAGAVALTWGRHRERVLLNSTAHRQH